MDKPFHSTPAQDFESAIILKVSATSHPPSIAGAIAGVIRDHQHAKVQAIGAAAVNQAVKALALAVLYLVKENIAIVFVPHFLTLVVDGGERTVIQFVIDLRPQ